MRSTELLKQQHRALERLVGEAISSQGPERIRLLGRLAEELTLHTALEEEHLFPALQRSGLERRAALSQEEDQRISALVAEILELKRHDPRLDAKVRELAQATREHLSAEERTVLPALEEAFSAEQLESMGEAMNHMAERLRGSELLKLAGDRESANA